MAKKDAPELQVEEEQQPVAEFVPYVPATRAVTVEGRASNLTRASHVNWKRTFSLLRSLGKAPR